MAVEQVFGGHTVWQCEMDKAASKVLAYRWGWRDVPNLGDITKVEWYEVPEIDVLCGGFPCQDVSAAGKRAGIQDNTRSGLWAVFADIIDILRPPIVVIENVRGLLSATAHRAVEPDDTVVGDRSDRPLLRAIGAVVGDLADLGYVGGYTVVSAASVGAPHRRERVFILATAADSKSGAGRDEEQQRVSPLRLRGESDVQQPRERGGGHALSGSNASDAPRTGWHEGRPESAGIVGGSDAAVSGDEPGVALLPTPRTSDTNGAGHHGDGGMDLRTTVTLLPTPAAQDGNGGGRYSSEGHQSTLPGEVRLLPTPKAHDGIFGSTAQTSGRPIENATHLQKIACLNPTSWGKYEPAIRRWEQIVGPAPAPTEPNKNGNPRLSAVFSEWLMGWPAGWVTDPDIGISRNDQLRIVGNGVCTQQAIAALRYLLAVTA
jgi:DNA (cytosine-5)-methyltransferase 1